MSVQTKIFEGKVYHKRFIPREHEFTYSTYFIKFSLKELPRLKSPFFSFNRFNLFSFYVKDHGFRDGSSLESFANALLKTAGLAADYDDIFIHTYPRVLGMVFIPVSFWYFMKNGQVSAMIAEVNNTFGGTHSYLLTPDQPEGPKVFHVSPFNQVKGHYKFRFTSKAEKEKVDIHYTINSKQVLFASVSGSPLEWSSKNLLKVFLRHPLHNALTLVFIHFEALRLYVKRIPFFGKDGAVHE